MQNFNIHLISADCLNRRFRQIVRIFNVDSLVVFFLNFNTTCTHKVVNGEQEIFVELGREFLQQDRGIFYVSHTMRFIFLSND